MTSNQPARPKGKSYPAYKRAEKIAQTTLDAIGPPEVCTLSALMQDDYRDAGCADMIQVDLPTYLLRMYHARDLEREHREMSDALVEACCSLKSGQTSRRELWQILWDAMPVPVRRELEQELRRRGVRL